MEVAGVGKRKERPKRRGEKRRSYAMSGRGRNREGEGGRGRKRERNAVDRGKKMGRGKYSKRRILGGEKGLFPLPGRHRKRRHDRNENPLPYSKFPASFGFNFSPSLPSTSFFLLFSPFLAN